MNDLPLIPKKKALSMVGGAAGIIMLATLLSRLTGWLRTYFIYAVMAPKGYSDQFLLAFTLPDITFNLLAGGAIAAALIPIMSSFLSKGREEEAWKALSTFLNVSMIALIGLEIVFFFWTEGFLVLIAPGYAGRAPEERAMLVSLTRILLLNVPFMMLAGQCNGILNSYRKFAAAAFGPVIYNICTILGIVLFGATDVYLAAWAIMGSAVIFFVVQMTATWKQFSRYRPRLELNHPAFRRMIRQAVPSLLSSTITEFNNIMTRSFATLLDKGMLTLLNNANRTWQLPMGIFAQSIGIAMLPTLSAHHAANETEEFKRLFYRGVRAVILICLPISVIMLFQNDQIMRLLFTWNAMQEVDVSDSGLALAGYAAALIFASVLGMTIRAFYAMHDSITPLVSGILGIAVNYGLNAVFQRYTDFGIGGTALAYTATSVFNTLILLAVFAKKTNTSFYRDNLGFFLKSAAAMIPSAAILWLLVRQFRPDVGSKISQIICVAVPAITCFTAFYLMGILLRIGEITLLRDMMGARLKRFQKKTEGNT